MELRNSTDLKQRSSNLKFLRMPRSFNRSSCKSVLMTSSKRSNDWSRTTNDSWARSFATRSSSCKRRAKWRTTCTGWRLIETSSSWSANRASCSSQSLNRRLATWKLKMGSAPARLMRRRLSRNRLRSRWLKSGLSKWQMLKDKLRMHRKSWKRRGSSWGRERKSINSCRLMLKIWMKELKS